MDENIYRVLDKIKTEINEEYGFEGDIPRINYGPCGVFANVFNEVWNKRFNNKVHICFIMTKDHEECDHICISLPTGELYDGGIGVHSREHYKEFTIVDMETYDYNLLDKWAYGLHRTYPRFCPTFDIDFVYKIINENLNVLLM